MPLSRTEYFPCYSCIVSLSSNRVGCTGQPPICFYSQSADNTKVNKKELRLSCTLCEHETWHTVHHRMLLLHYGALMQLLQCVCVCVYVCVCVCMCVCQKERSTELEQMCVLAGEFRLTESEKANVFAACLVFQWNNCLSWSYDIRELT